MVRLRSSGTRQVGAPGRGVGRIERRVVAVGLRAGCCCMVPRERRAPPRQVLRDRRRCSRGCVWTVLTPPGPRFSWLVGVLVVDDRLMVEVERRVVDRHAQTRRRCRESPGSSAARRCRGCCSSAKRTASSMRERHDRAGAGRHLCREGERPLGLLGGGRLHEFLEPRVGHLREHGCSSQAGHERRRRSTSRSIDSVSCQSSHLSRPSVPLLQSPDVPVADRAWLAVRLLPF